MSSPRSGEMVSQVRIAGRHRDFRRYRPWLRRCAMRGCNSSEAPASRICAAQGRRRRKSRAGLPSAPASPSPRSAASSLRSSVRACLLTPRMALTALRASSGRLARRCSANSGLQADDRQAVADHIVHLACDPQSLFNHAPVALPVRGCAASHSPRACDSLRKRRPARREQSPRAQRHAQHPRKAMAAGHGPVTRAPWIRTARRRHRASTRSRLAAISSRPGRRPARATAPAESALVDRRPEGRRPCRRASLHTRAAALAAAPTPSPPQRAAHSRRPRSPGASPMARC